MRGVSQLIKSQIKSRHRRCFACCIQRSGFVTGRVHFYRVGEQSKHFEAVVNDNNNRKIAPVSYWVNIKY